MFACVSFLVVMCFAPLCVALFCYAFVYCVNVCFFLLFHVWFSEFSLFVVFVLCLFRGCSFLFVARAFMCLFRRVMLCVSFFVVFLCVP